MTAKLEFKDPKLQDVTKQYAKEFEMISEELQHINDDIKALEHFLNYYVVRIPATVSSDHLTISWNFTTHGKARTWRVLCVQEPLKPLLECKVAQRLAARVLLPLLVKQLADSIPELKDQHEK